MASSHGTTSSDYLANSIHHQSSNKTFPSFETKSTSPTGTGTALSRNRATTIQNGVISSKLVVPPPLPHSPDELSSTQAGDIFVRRPSLGDEEEEEDDDDNNNNNGDLDHSLGRSQSLPERFDELPIELISLTDRFVESLATKKYSAPLPIEKLADIFQEFYLRAASHVATHISTLSSRLNRNSSPTPSLPTRGSGNRKGPLIKSGKDSAESLEKQVPDQQMLTASEVAERRKARRMLEYKRVALEDAVEKRVCEMVYDKIWRHRSTLDEVEDEKLRSKTAALSLVGIGPKDLGIGVEEGQNKADSMYSGLNQARESLAKMNDDKYPLGKLRHLTAAHQAIVDALSNIHPSSSSADEILPTLIYTLITSPAEGINIISNLHFVQRFRTRGKIDGEAAYCLTNLEAAISFLDNVDLPSLRAGEVPEGPSKNHSRPETPTSNKHLPSMTETKPSVPTSPGMIPSEPEPVASGLKSTSSTSLEKSSTPTSSSHNRRLSQLLQPPAKAFGAANDAVRNTADQGLKNIGSTLDNSFKFLFGRLKEEQINRASDDVSSNVVVPKTLDDARRLVYPPQPADDVSNMSDTSSLADTSEVVNDPLGARTDDKVLGIIGGMRRSRERSVDSVKSNGSGRKVAFAGPSPLQDSVSSQELPAKSSTPNANPLDTMRNLGNSLNPLNLGMNVMRGFGRSTAEASQTVAAGAEKAKENATPSSSQSPPAIAAVEIPKIKPPNQSFLNAKDASDLKIGDVSELLEDYKRLAVALKDLGSF